MKGAQMVKHHVAGMDGPVVEMRADEHREKDPGQWYVTTAWFKDGGKWISGPYSTMDDAVVARATIEKMSGREGAYWLDSKANPRG